MAGYLDLLNTICLILSARFKRPFSRSARPLKIFFKHNIHLPKRDNNIKMLASLEADVQTNLFNPLA